MFAARRTFATASTLAGLAALAALSLLHPIDGERRCSRVCGKAHSAPNTALGPAKAPVAIVEYASMSCPHCAGFEQNVFSMLKSKYIDTGEVRLIFREFPLNVKAVAASMRARCICGDDAGKYFGAVEALFKAQYRLMEHTTDILKQIGKQLAGMREAAVETCVRDQAMLDKLKADQNYAFETLKVDATPTFFVNGEKLRGAMSFVRALLKR